ncbi:MAG TPA: YbhN family protein [Thermoleophilaceae bacterium]
MSEELRKDTAQPEVHAPETEEIEQAGTRLLEDKRRIVGLLLAFVLLIVAIYVLLPKVAGVGGALHRLGNPKWGWIVVALAFTVCAFLAYGACFRELMTTRARRQIVQRLQFGPTYEITVAAFGATALFSAGGAGGIALTYWALRRAGMPRRETVGREVAFLAVLYTIYLGTVLVFGVLLRTGVLNGAAPVAGTIVPAGLAGGALLIIGLLALIPGDMERRIRQLGSGGRFSRVAERVAAAPATVSTGVRFALSLLSRPRYASMAILGAFGYWAAMLGILWASFKAFGGGVPLGVLVQGFFVGMAANLAPSPAAGVGTLDAGLIGSFLLFDQPSHTVFPAVLAFRLVGFWLPIIPGVIAYFRVRRRVAEWQREDAADRYTIKSKVSQEARTARLTAEES